MIEYTPTMIVVLNAREESPLATSSKRETHSSVSLMFRTARFLHVDREEVSDST